METVKVQWHSLKNQWLVTTANQQELPFAQWAEQLPDLTQVRMVLSALNYSAHWLSLVGVSQRHLAKVLPFALEESLIEDIHHYAIVPAGVANKRFRAYVVANELLEQLLETCDLHHVRVQELIPETALFGKEFLCVRSAQGWLFNWPGVFEGFVGDSALTPILESLSEGEHQLDTITIKAASLDQINLFKTLLETSFVGQVEQLNSEVIAPDTPFEIPTKAINLLTGKYQQRTPKENKPAVWWKPVAGLAAAWLLLWTVGLYTEVSTLKQQAHEVRGQSLALYKQLFPGERIRALERQFQEKLSGGSSTSATGFASNTYTLAQVYAQQNLKEKVELLSLRYNERMAETTLEIKAKSLAELQALRQALEESGLTAEIASATNDKDGVKGRVRIAG